LELVQYKLQNENTIRDCTLKNENTFSFLFICTLKKNAKEKKDIIDTYTQNFGFSKFINYKAQVQIW